MTRNVLPAAPLTAPIVVPMRRSTRTGGPRRRMWTHCVVPALTVPAVLDRSSGAWTAIALIVPSFVLSRGVAGSSGVHRIVRIRVRRARAIFPRPFGSPEHFSPQGPSTIGGPISVRWRIADIISTRRPFPALAALAVAVAVAVALRSRCWAATAGRWTPPAGSRHHPLVMPCRFRPPENSSNGSIPHVQLVGRGDRRVCSSQVSRWQLFGIRRGIICSFSSSHAR